VGALFALAHGGLVLALPTTVLVAVLALPTTVLFAVLLPAATVLASGHKLCIRFVALIGVIPHNQLMRASSGRPLAYLLRHSVGTKRKRACKNDRTQRH